MSRVATALVVAIVLGALLMTVPGVLAEKKKEECLVTIKLTQIVVKIDNGVGQDEYHFTFWVRGTRVSYPPGPGTFDVPGGTAVPFTTNVNFQIFQGGIGHKGDVVSFRLVFRATEVDPIANDIAQSSIGFAAECPSVLGLKGTAFSASQGVSVEFTFVITLC